MRSPKPIVLALVPSTSTRRRYRILLTPQNTVVCTCKAGQHGRVCGHLAAFRAALAKVA